MRKTVTGIISVIMLVCMLTCMLSPFTASAEATAEANSNYLPKHEYIFRKTFDDGIANTGGSQSACVADNGFFLSVANGSTYTLENNSLKFTSMQTKDYMDVRFYYDATSHDCRQNFIFSFWIKPDTDDLDISTFTWKEFSCADIQEKDVFKIIDGNFKIANTNYPNAHLAKDEWSLVEIVFNYDETATSVDGKQGATTSYTFLLNGEEIATAPATYYFNNIDRYRFFQWAYATYEIDDMTYSLGTESLIDVPRTGLPGENYILREEFGKGTVNTNNVVADIAAADGFWLNTEKQTVFNLENKTLNYIENNAFIDLRFFIDGNKPNMARDLTFSFWINPSVSDFSTSLAFTERKGVTVDGTSSDLSDDKIIKISKGKLNINSTNTSKTIPANQWTHIELLCNYDPKATATNGKIGAFTSFTVLMNGEFVQTMSAHEGKLMHSLDSYRIFRYSNAPYAIDDLTISQGLASNYTAEGPTLCQHTGGSATCTAKAVCSECGASYGELKAHTPADPDKYDCKNTCTVCGESYTVECTAPISFSGVYLKLNENINVVYTVKTHSCVENPYMEFTFRGKEYTVSEYTTREDGTLAFAFEKVMPYYMAKEITATLYATKDGEAVSVVQSGVSVKNYCDKAVELNPDDAEFLALASDLLVYGAKSQVYVNYKTDELATDGVEWLAPTEFAVPENDFELCGEASDAYTWTGAGLNLTNEMNMYISFSADSIEGLSVMFTINGREYTYDVSAYTPDENGKYKVYFYGINAYEFGDAVTVNFVVDEAVVGDTLSYSIDSYINYMYTSSNEALADLVKAISNYGKSAFDYKN